MPSNAPKPAKSPQPHGDKDAVLRALKMRMIAHDLSLTIIALRAGVQYQRASAILCGRLDSPLELIKIRDAVARLSLDPDDLLQGVDALLGEISDAQTERAVAIIKEQNVYIGARPNQPSRRGAAHQPRLAAKAEQIYRQESIT